MSALTFACSHFDPEAVVGVLTAVGFSLVRRLRGRRGGNRRLFDSSFQLTCALLSWKAGFVAFRKRRDSFTPAWLLRLRRSGVVTGHPPLK